MTINTTITNVTCYNGTNGAINISVTGGTAPYKYQLAEAGAGAWSSSASYTGLAANVYPVSVKDNTGCIKTIYVTITQPANFSIAYTANDVTCLGGNTGNISVNVTGGTSPYTYAWKKDGVAFATTQNINSLTPANYYLIVTDAAGCTTSPIVQQQIKAISLTGFNEDVVANGTNASSVTSTSQAFDDGNGNVFYENGYTNLTGTAETPGGLPTGGAFNSTQDATRPYQLASYSANNSLLLRSSTATTYGGATSGTLTFGSQYKSNYSTLYVIGSTGSGTGTVSYTVNFADNTTATGQLGFADWYLASSTQSAIKAKRITRATPSTYDTRYDFNLFELPIAISGADQSKTINSVTFTWAGADNARTNIMGITGYTSTSYGIHINDGTSANVTPAVAITTPNTTFCTGQSVTFTATPTNGGLAPTYQWKKNNVNITGATSSTYTTTGLANNDVIKVVLTSNLPCVTTSTATSNSLTMINGTATAGVSIATATTSICSGTAVSFTATPTNGGASPSYQWKLNNANVGSNSPTWSSSSLANGDQVKLVMTSSIGCAVNNPATSGTVSFVVTNNLTPSVNVVSVPAVPYNNAPVVFTATPTNGGLTPAYQWYKNGSTVAGAILPVLAVAAPTSGDSYSVKLTSSYSCVTAPYSMSNYTTIALYVLPVTLEWYNARPENGKAVLQWKTAQESNSKQFNIERANVNNPTSFTVVGHVQSTNKPNGDTYNFIDAPGSGIFLYRLTQEDIDAHQRSLGIRKVDLANRSAWTVQDQGGGWMLSTTGAFSYRVFDASGRLIKQGRGNNNVTIGKPEASGIYLLQFESNGESHTQKLIH
jgi:hypothetical protein